MRYEDENIWLTQKMMATVYYVSAPAINQHLKRIFADNELEGAAVIKQCLATAADGKNYQVKHYSLEAIIAVGFKIKNERAVQFHKWANQSIKGYTIHGLSCKRFRSLTKKIKISVVHEYLVTLLACGFSHDAKRLQSVEGT